MVATQRRRGEVTGASTIGSQREPQQQTEEEQPGNGGNGNCRPHEARPLCRRARVLVARGGPRAAGAIRRGLGGAGAGSALLGGISLIGEPVSTHARVFTRASFCKNHQHYNNI